MNMPSGQFMCGTRYMYYKNAPSEPCRIGIQMLSRLGTSTNLKIYP
jgi:hypothetical protein